MATISDENDDEIVDENGLLLADILTVIIWGPELEIDITTDIYTVDIA